MLSITHLTVTNMTGVDRYFTQITRNPLGRWVTYGTFPFYLLFSGRGYKVLRDQHIVACAFVHLRHVSAYVFNVNVDQPYRRQGIGQSLMEHLELVAARNGRTWMALQVDDGNWPAQHLYDRIGYRPYHPLFLRLESGMDVGYAITEGVTIQPLRRLQGRTLFNRYMNIERKLGDLWAAPILIDYDLLPSSGGSFWRCLLNGEEIGCARLATASNRLQVRLMCKPEYWDHITVGGLVKLLAAEIRTRHGAVDVFLGSSGHHEAAEIHLTGLGFRSRIQQRILMLKPLNLNQKD